MPLIDRRAKIVATLGPSTDIPFVLERMIRAGMNVARLNFSHGTLSEHKKRIQSVRRLSKQLGKPIAILMDLQGPKIRTGSLKGGKSVHLIKNRKIQITTKSVLGNAELVATTYSHLPLDVKKGDPILLDDGRMRLKVLSKTKQEVSCRVEHGGWLREHTGMNLPGTRLSKPALTKKDLEDLRFGMQAGVDAVALSFVRSANDILQLKKILRSKKYFVPVIAKIERNEAVENLDEILEEAEGVMVARGDLGVEIALERLPILQKDIIRRANEAGAVVITATQMLDSMMHSPRPTRAETTDVANAVFDGTDCLMLSGETAAGKYPIEAVGVMSRIIIEAEKRAEEIASHRSKYQHPTEEFVHAVVHSACHAAEEVDAQAIMVFTMTGATCRMISKLKPHKPIIGLTPSMHSYNQMAMGWGIHPVISPLGKSIEEMFHHGQRTAIRKGLLKKGDVVVVVCGSRLTRGSTNMMKILKVV